MKYIAIIGYGVVGGGITELVRVNQEKIRKVVGDGVEVKYILDLREFPDSPYADRVVHTLDPILADGEVELVCETMGGSHPALEYSLSCMKAGKSVVTSNKEVVANFGDVLSECAKKNGVSYLFEASVGGGIPVIRSFATSLPQDEIVQVSGIVNGTTNYILTRMEEEEALSFEDALKEAQELGYAERNPSADVDGIDAKRKIMILSALAGGILPGEDDVYAGSLRGITQADLAGAAKLGGRVKLIAEARLEEDGLTAYVCPMIVGKDDPLGRISGVYNGISVRFALTGDILYYGRGAGRYPTAGAIVADMCAGLSGAAKAEFMPVFVRSGSEGAVKSFASAKFPYYVRAEGSVSELLERLEEACGNAKLIAAEDGIAEIETGEADEKTLTDALCGVTVQSVLRIRS